MRSIDSPIHLAISTIAPSTPRLRTQGQALVEFSVCAILTSLVFVLASDLLKTQWSRVQCIYWVFKKTHARLVRQSEPFRTVSFFEGDFAWRGPVRVYETRHAIVGEAHCGGLQEKVSLPKLESIP